MRKGELWIVHIPGLGGHAQQGTCPALVVAAPKLPVVIVMPCTSNLQALRFPHTLRMAASKQNGLTTLSVALVFQLLAIDRRFMQQKIGTLEKPLLAHIDRYRTAGAALSSHTPHTPHKNQRHRAGGVF